MNKCIVEGCDAIVVARGFCAKHYKQMRRHGKLNEPPNRERICSEKECNESVYARGLCRKHYNALRWRERKGVKELL